MPWLSPLSKPPSTLESSASAPSKSTFNFFSYRFHGGTRKGFEMLSEQPRFKLSALRRRNELLCRIDMWGFVSVMLAILVWTWFGLPHPPRSYKSSVDMAIAVHSSPQPGALKEDDMLISITRDGNVFFRDHRVVRSE